MGKRQLGFYLDQQHCTGCATCQVACKDKHDLPPGQFFRRVWETAGGSFRAKGETVKAGVYAYWVSLSCNHCRAPLCVDHCPAGAMQKREADGIVFVDRDRCIGCRRCAAACPYGAPVYDPGEGKTGKCDFCRDLLARGKPPACVAACPNGALDWGPVEELAAQYGGVNGIKGMPDPAVTLPSLLLKPHRDAAL